MQRRWLGGGKGVQRASSPAERLDRLAARIQALAEKDEHVLRRARELGETRRRAAVELHGVCASLAEEINRRVARLELEVSPEQYNPDSFNEDGVNLIQVNVRGRIMQFEFEATPELVSTEEFRIPYTLSGSIRCFNHELLQRETIEEQLMFYCLEKKVRQWRFFDARTYRSGPLDRDYLVSLLERLI